MADFLGYLGLLFLIISLTQNKLKLVRIWGIISCSILLVQALLLSVTSLLVINAVIISLHSYKLFKG